MELKACIVEEEEAQERSSAVEGEAAAVQRNFAQALVCKSKHGRGCLMTGVQAQSATEGGLPKTSTSERDKIRYYRSCCRLE